MDRASRLRRAAFAAAFASCASLSACGGGNLFIGRTPTPTVPPTLTPTRTPTGTPLPTPAATPRPGSG